jgi:hypothetical protein
MRMDIKFSPAAASSRCQRAVRGKLGLADGASASGLGDVQEKRVCSTAHPGDLARMRTFRFNDERRRAGKWVHSSVNLVSAPPSHRMRP